MSQFKPEEMIERRNKDGKMIKYPVVGGRLRVAHEENESLSIITDLIQFEAMSHAYVKATVTTQKGDCSAYGCASVEKDEFLKDSLLELAETRAIARALRFSGYGVEYTGVEEIPSVPEKAKSQRAKPKPKAIVPASSVENDELVTATRAQIHAIEKMSTLKSWNPITCCQRILNIIKISSLQDLSKDDASKVIGRMKEVA